VLWIVALAVAALGQNGPQERSFTASKTAVDAALRGLQLGAGGRLPTVDGFIAEQSLAPERLERPRYTYSVDVLAKPSGSLVRVRAHITAWFAGATAAQSGYRELASNGRLEADLLERLEDALALKGGVAASIARPAASSDTVPATVPPVKAAASNPMFTAPRPGAVALPPRNSGEAAADDSSGYAQTLREQAKNLEEILRNQTRPTDLAAVRRAKTPVYSRPSEQGEVLFLADAEDEFQVLNTSTDWVHVQISGLSRGWIRGADLELPTSRAVSPPANVAPAPVAPGAGAAGAEFRLIHQEVNTYPGNWAPLRGKSVRIYSLAPTGTEPTNASQKWEAARVMLQRAAARLAAQDNAATAPVEGVVLIFDSADGGMVSATVTSLREWDAGRLSEDVFRGQCSFDPPEAFASSGR
jgi:hypothetical protein